MYSDDDLEAAITEGILGSDAVTAFRAFVARRQHSSQADEESVRLVTSFNDIFVTIAATLLLWALGWLGGRVSPALGPALAAGAAWSFAEYFTRRRRMALPSIALLLSFVWNVFSAGLAVTGTSELSQGGYGLAGSAALATLAAYGHWLRFRVPVTVAAGALSLAGTGMALALAAIPAIRGWTLPLIFVAGLSLFALAMAWDASDRERKTRRSDVAFWLHLAAAPLMVHPVFSALGAVGASQGTALAAIGLYLALALVALATDRRALLVSALGYVLYAMSALFQAAGSVSGSFPLTALAIGAMLLLLSALWHQTRARVLGLLPSALRDRLPPA